MAGAVMQDPCSACWRLHPAGPCPPMKQLVALIPGDVTKAMIRDWEVFPPETAVMLYPQGMVTVLFALGKEPFESTEFVKTLAERRDEQIEEDWPPHEEQTFEDQEETWPVP